MEIYREFKLILERGIGFAPMTSYLVGKHSTTELPIAFMLDYLYYYYTKNYIKFTLILFFLWRKSINKNNKSDSKEVDFFRKSIRELIDCPLKLYYTKFIRRIYYGN